jgi:hypothetical protein
LNLSHLEPIDCPLPNLQIFLACVISGIDLIFHSFVSGWVSTVTKACVCEPRPTRYRAVVLTSWERALCVAIATRPALANGLLVETPSGLRLESVFQFLDSLAQLFYLFTHLRQATEVGV